MEYLLLIIWIIILIKWADILVDWASSIAYKYWISSLVIWLTIIAFWTSAPEFVVSFVSWIKWASDLAISNVIWSNIANTALVLWVTALIYKIKMPTSTIKKEIPFMIFISILLITLIWSFLWFWEAWSLHTIEWILLSIFFIWFLYYTYTISKNKDLDEDIEVKKISIQKSIIYIILWLIWLLIWWELIVNNAVKIALNLWLSNAFIWVTIIAIWTSLPELAASITAAFKKNTNLMLWAIVWSNIFNILWILWFSSLFIKLESYDWVYIDLLVVLFVSILLFIFAFTHKKFILSKIEWMA